MKWIAHLLLIAISAGSGYFGAKVETSLRDARSVAAATPDVSATVGKSDDAPTSSPVSLVSSTPASPVTTSTLEEAVDPATLPEVATTREVAMDPPALAVVKETPVDPSSLPTVAAKEEPVTSPALPTVVAAKEDAVTPPALPVVVAPVGPTPAPTITEERTPPAVVVVPSAPAPAVVAKKDEEKSVVVTPPKKDEPKFRTVYQTVTETVYVQQTESYTVCLGRGRCETRTRTVLQPQTVSRQVAVQVPDTSAADTTPSPSDRNVVSAPAPTSTPAPMVACVPCGSQSNASPYNNGGASYGSNCGSSSQQQQQGYSSCGRQTGGNRAIVHGQPLRNIGRALVNHCANKGGGFRGGNGGGLFRCR